MTTEQQTFTSTYRYADARTERLSTYVRTGTPGRTPTGRRIPLCQDINELIQEVHALRAFKERAEQEARSARSYPWPEKTPAFRLQQAAERGLPDTSTAADLRQLLHTYSLLVLVSKRGESP